MIYEEKRKRGFPACSIHYPWICKQDRPCKLFTTAVHSRPCHIVSQRLGQQVSLNSKVLQTVGVLRTGSVEHVLKPISNYQLR
jgi:hypothetical protein